jgi:hypothetical protein
LVITVEAIIGVAICTYIHAGMSAHSSRCFYVSKPVKRRLAHLKPPYDLDQDIK